MLRAGADQWVLGEQVYLAGSCARKRRRRREAVIQRRHQLIVLRHRRQAENQFHRAKPLPVPPRLATKINVSNTLMQRIQVSPDVN